MRRRSFQIEPSEKAIVTAVVEHWRKAGTPLTLVASIPNARAFGQAGLTKGLPDLLVIAPWLPVAFIELKKKKDTRTKEQLDFAELCTMNRIQYALAIGRDEPIEILKRWGVLRP